MDDTPHDAVGVEHLTQQGLEPAIRMIGHVLDSVDQKCENQCPKIHKRLVRDEEINRLPAQLMTAEQNEHH